MKGEGYIYSDHIIILIIALLHIFVKTLYKSISTINLLSIT